MTATAVTVENHQCWLNIAYAMIMSQLDPTVHDWLGDNMLNPHAIWTQLTEWFNSKDFNKTSDSYTKYFQSSFLETETTHNFLARLTKLHHHITTSTMQISDNCHIWHVLNSLPSSYIPLATALCIQKEKTIDYVEKAIINYKSTLKKSANTKSTTISMALYTNGHNNWSGPNKSSGQHDCLQHQSRSTQGMTSRSHSDCSHPLELQQNSRGSRGDRSHKCN